MRAIRGPPLGRHSGRLTQPSFGIMIAMEPIYIALLNEGVDVWRPVEATAEENAVFRLNPVEPDASEEWEFAPGSRVRCELRDLGDGPVLVAVATA